MKKTFITAISFLVLYGATAQKAQIGLMVGGTNSNFKIKSEGEDFTGDSKTGFAGGLVANFSLSENCSIRSGLSLIQKGTKTEISMGGFTATGELNTSWLEVPVSLTYNSGNFFVGAGPSLSFGVGGKWKSKLEDEPEESGKVKFGNSDEDDLKGFDFGVNVLAGFQFNNGLFVAANFNQGFSNLTPGDTGDDTMKSHYFGLHLGYMLKGKK
jgi:hypothetical protein